MAEQKICDRAHKVVIPTGEEFYSMTFKTPEGEQRIDLCAQCGLEFKAFMSATPAQGLAAGQIQQVDGATTTGLPPTV